MKFFLLIAFLLLSFVLSDKIIINDPVPTILPIPPPSPSPSPSPSPPSPSPSPPSSSPSVVPVPSTSPTPNYIPVILNPSNTDFQFVLLSPHNGDYCYPNQACVVNWDYLNLSNQQYFQLQILDSNSNVVDTVDNLVISQKNYSYYFHNVLTGNYYMILKFDDSNRSQGQFFYVSSQKSGAMNNSVSKVLFGVSAILFTWFLI